MPDSRAELKGRPLRPLLPSGAEPKALAKSCGDVLRGGTFPWPGGEDTPDGAAAENLGRPGAGPGPLAAGGVGGAPTRRGWGRQGFLSGEPTFVRIGSLFSCKTGFVLRRISVTFPERPFFNPNLMNLPQALRVVSLSLSFPVFLKQNIFKLLFSLDYSLFSC